MEKYFRQYDTCRQNERPFCSVACPFHVDVLDFQSKMANNNYNAAFKTFRNAVGFPDIVAALCPEYCASVCPRGETDQSVQLNLLEKTCVARASKKDPTDYNVPLKNRKIAVIGAGISGLACALRLTQKKYDVTIYEKTGRLGGKLWDVLFPEIFLEDIKRQFQFEKYALHFNTEIKSIDEIRDQGFEAVYAATGGGGFDFGAMNHENGHSFMDGGIAVFAGGSLTGKDPVRALADGLDMAWAVEVFLKTGRLEYPEGEKPCKAVADPDKLVRTEGVIPTDNGLFTDAEAAAEAGRCIRCQCDACMKYCDVCAYHNKWPMRIRDDVMATVAFSTSESMIKKTPAKRLMNTCTQCGLCDEVCPEGIEIGAMLLEARRSLHRQGTLPGAYHQFWVRDMEFTNGEFAALARKAPEQEARSGQRAIQKYAFFPGCQLGAADPRYVTEPYRWLLSKQPDTGLLLRCCGVPAEWAGNEEMHESAITDLRRDWEQLGRPALIYACPACRKHLQEYLPEIETVSLYEILDRWGFKAEDGAGNRNFSRRYKEFSIFDPCTARHIEPLEQAVRALAKQTGVLLEELPKGDKHGCCGYGGHVSEANADYAAWVATRRSGLSENPYIAYCINCRDVFQGEGKPALHILDLLFAINGLDAALPNLTERRRNRINLKRILLKEIWGEDMEKKPEPCKFRLKIGKEIQEKMNRLKLLEEDICEVLKLAETSKRRTFDPQRGTWSCYRELGQLTCWVEYRPDGEEFEIVNVYIHRMKIQLEGVWNGRKTEIDL
ncbi:MAG TPA: FAD-dependent oxidoreductase [Anaerovoracaceae bacterium]|nr:FAD-dependent oxidoreductase [Anaerovoracaceae bacterium]